MKKFEITEDKRNELVNFLAEQPFKIANPILGFLQEHLKEVAEGDKEDPPVV